MGSLLAHIAEPSPYAPPVQGWRDDANGGDGGNQFKAAVFISPWAFMQRPGAMLAADDRWDYLSREQGGRFQDAWAPKVDDVWANLCGSSHEGEERVWGRVFGRNGQMALVKKTLVTVGTAEVLLDSCRKFGRECVGAKTMVLDRTTDIVAVEREMQEKDAVTVECVGEAHVQPALDAALGYKEGVMMRVILSWLSMFGEKQYLCKMGAEQEMDASMLEGEYTFIDRT